MPHRLTRDRDEASSCSVRLPPAGLAAALARANSQRGGADSAALGGKQ